MTTDLKRMAAAAACDGIPEGIVLGLGSGSTVQLIVEEIGRRNLQLAGVVPASEATAAAARAVGLRIVDLTEVDGVLELALDGADEIDAGLRAIKGGGGAHAREKVVAAAARTFICVVDESKLVLTLGSRPVPIEVLPMARALVIRRIRERGGEPITRGGRGTDNGNPILDVRGLDLSDPAAIERDLELIPGVVACGIFARRSPDEVVVGTAGGVRRLRNALP